MIHRGPLKQKWNVAPTHCRHARPWAGYASTVFNDIYWTLVVVFPIQFNSVHFQTITCIISNKRCPERNLWQCLVSADRCSCREKFLHAAIVVRHCMVCWNPHSGSDNTLIQTKGIMGHVFVLFFPSGPFRSLVVPICCSAEMKEEFALKSICGRNPRKSKVSLWLTLFFRNALSKATNRNWLSSHKNQWWVPEYSDFSFAISHLSWLRVKRTSYSTLCWKPTERRDWNKRTAAHTECFWWRKVCFRFVRKCSGKATTGRPHPATERWRTVNVTLHILWEAWKQQFAVIYAQEINPEDVTSGTDG